MNVQTIGKSSMNIFFRFTRVEGSRWHLSLSTSLVRGAGTAVLWIALGGSVAAQEASSDADALAKAAQNPLAAMVTLPMQFNFSSGVGAFDRESFNLNIQPVVPITGDKWNLIARTIIPVNSVPQGQTDSTFGIGDTTLQLFFSPAEASKLTWGIGPVISMPTASNREVLGSGKWGAGPGAVVFYTAGKWTMGGLLSNLWSIGGDSDRSSYNFMTLQYFVNYNMGSGWAVGTAPVITANWKADSSERWTVPWGLQVSKVTKIAAQPVNLLLGYYSNSEHPTNGVESQVRFQVNFMFPSGG